MFSNVKSSSIGNTYSCQNQKNERFEIPANKVVKSALAVIKQDGKLHFNFSEISSKLYFYNKKKEITYTVNFKFIVDIIAVAEKEGITISKNEEYSTGQLIGEDYGLTGVMLTKV